MPADNKLYQRVVAEQNIVLALARGGWRLAQIIEMKLLKMII